MNHYDKDLIRNRRQKGVPIDKPMYVHTARIAKATDEQIVEAYLQMRSSERVAEKLGVSPPTVLNAVKRSVYAVRRTGRPRKASK